MMDKALLQGNATDTDLGNGVTATKYTDEGNACGCFFSNINTTIDFTVVFEGAEYFLPAWSVSVAPDCKLEVYNTAKVNTETHIMIKKPDTCKEGSEKLSWSWLPEVHGDNLKGVGSFSAHKLLEQTSTTVDDSDYLWYLTSVDVKEKEVMVLSVNTTGHVLHAFVNGELVGSQYSLNSEWDFVFEKNVSLNAGINYVSLLSATVGLDNYGSFFEYDSYGIVGGPVKLIGSGNNSMDLTENKWSYKVDYKFKFSKKTSFCNFSFELKILKHLHQIGLNGMEKQQLFADENCSSKRLQWKTDYIPTLRPFTWYKANFDAPIGTEPVVVDLLGMGKGAAWVNGYSLGRFWPNYTADPNACKPCDYRGQYTDSRCRTNCGEPSQRWYHIPRSFLKAGLPNTLVLFEEFGGDPLGINFQTVTVGTTCAKVDEGKTLALTCQAGRLISDITFASYGDIQGECGSFKKAKCESGEPVLSLIKQECIGKPWCSIDATNEKLGACATCAGIPKKLAVEAALNVSYDSRAITIDGERRVLISGSIRYPRSTGQYNFEGGLNFIHFIKLVHSAGLYVFLRIGPYVCSEWKFGAIPVWLHQIPGVEFRTDNQIFKYGAAGQKYFQWCANFAESLDVGVPWIMCQQPNSPLSMINTCNGLYCDEFQPSSPNFPKMWTENWTGWFKAWCDADPHRSVEDVALAITKFFESGAT
ncbi:putative beta-galactosidase [Dioscorea sansibarensis]